MEKPKIRFKGYQEDWEQRKLSDVVDSVDTGKSRFDKEGSSGEYPILGSTSVIGYDDEYDYEGDFILTARVGANAGSLYRHAGKVKISDNTVFIQASQNIEFLYQLLIQFDIKKLSFGTGQPLVKASELKSLELMMPSDMKEQMRIGVYFKNLDSLITLHQRKCEEMKTLKKYMLQKMFPQNGQSVPQIRFSGFTEDWEQRKLGDVFEQTSNLVNPKEDEIELWSLTVEDGLTKKSDRYNREFLVKKDDNFKEVRPGDIVYNPMNMTLGAVGYNGMAKSVAVSGYYTTMVAKENYDTYYINTWLKSPQAIRLYRTYATGSLIEKQRVQFPTLSIIPVTFPKYEEQIKIGSYFHSLDNLITLHQQKCDELRNIKKFMLQNMFI